MPTSDQSDGPASSSESTAGNTPWEKEHSKWIEDNVHHRKCFHFSKNDDTDECICGVKRRHHEVSGRSLPSWRKELNTKQAPATFYGTLKGNIKFIRLDDDTDPATLKRLLFEKWGLPKPKWIISVFGKDSYERTSFSTFCESMDKLVKDLPSDVMLLWGMFEESVEGMQSVLSKMKYHQRITSVIFYPWAILFDENPLNEEPLLHLAVQTNNLSSVQDMLSYDVDIDPSDELGRTPLHVAAGNGFKDIVVALIKEEADVNDYDYDGFRPLHFAVYRQHDEVITELLEKGAKVDVNAERSFSITPLHIAVQKGALKEAELLLEKMESADTYSEFGHTPLHIAASMGSQEMVKNLLKRKSDVDATDQFGFTPLHFAVYNAHGETLTTLLENGANINEKTHKFGQTPLHIAGSRGSREIVKKLLKGRADISARDQFGFTPLHYAVYGNHEETVKYLLKKGADLNCDDNTAEDGDEEAPVEMKPVYYSHICRDVRVCHETGILCYERTERRVGQFVAARPLNVDCNKFSLQILTEGGGRCIGLGLVSKDYPAGRMPGWSPTSYAYHADDGGIFLSEGRAAEHMAEVMEGETMACALDLEQQTITFYKGAEKVKTVENVDIPPGGLFPAIGLDSMGESVRLLDTAAWSAPSTGQSPPLPRAFDTYKSPNLWISPGRTVRLRNFGYRRKALTGWLLLHNPSDAVIGYVVSSAPSFLDYVGQIEANKSRPISINTYSMSTAPTFKSLKIVWFTLESDRAYREEDIKEILKSPTPKCYQQHSLKVDSQVEPEEKEIKWSNEMKKMSGYSPLHLAVDRQNEKVAKKLLELNADINFQAKDGTTPLHIAAVKDSKETMKLLLRQKADVNTATSNGVTPLHIAVYKNNKKYVKYLLNKKADINKQATNGITPLQMAQKEGREDIAETFRSAEKRDKTSSASESREQVEECVDHNKSPVSGDNGEDSFQYVDGQHVHVGNMDFIMQVSQKKINRYEKAMKKMDITEEKEDDSDDEDNSDDDEEREKKNDKIDVEEDEVKGDRAKEHVQDVNVLFLDNGSAHGETALRSMLRYPANLATSLACREEGSDIISTVALAFGGESYSFKIIQNFVNCGIPVVLIKGSGGAPDDLIKVMEKSLQRRGVYDTYMSNTSIEKVWSILGADDFSENEVQVCHQLLEKADFLNIVSITDRKQSLYDAVLSAIVRANDEEFLTRFADMHIESSVQRVSWLSDDADLAAEEKRKRILKDILFKAIISNKIQCVEFTLDWVGGDIKVADLYLKTKKDLTREAEEILNNLEQQVDMKSEKSEEKEVEDEDVIDGEGADSKSVKSKDALSESNTHVSEEDEVDSQSMNEELHNFRHQVLNEFLPPGCLTVIDTSHKAGDCDSAVSRRDRRRNYQDFFLWAVLTKRREVATVFWKRSEDLIVSALVAASLLDKLGKLTSNNKRRKDRELDAMYFRHLLIATLDLCFGSDVEQTLNILENICKQNCWGVDFFKLALHEDNKMLFQSNCISHYIDNKWMGSLPVKASTWRIFLCAIAPPLLKPLLKTDRSKRGQKKKKISTEELEVLIQMNGPDLSSDTVVRSATFKTIIETRLNVALKWKQLGKLCATKNEKCTDLVDRLKGKYKNRPSATEGNSDKCKVTPGIIDQQLERTSVKFSGSLGRKKLSYQDFRKKLEDNLNLQLEDKEYDSFLDTVTQDQDGYVRCEELVQKLNFKQKGISLKHLFDAPVVKYIYNVGSFLIFLALYAHLLLNALKPSFTAEIEIPLLIWIASFTVEEFIQFVDFVRKDKEWNAKRKTERQGELIDKTKEQTFWSSFGLYYDDLWNVLDALCIALFCVGYPMVHAAPTAEVYGYGRLILCIDFMCFFWRVFQAFTPSKTIGPMLFMIFKMVAALVPFLVILFATLASYAIATEALLFPGSELTLDFVYNVPRRAYWQMFGELSLEEIEASCAGPGCPSVIGRTWVPVLLGCYMLITNVLLLNLLIAKFNFIFENIQTTSDEVWAWQKYRLMKEYADRCNVPVPFSLFWRVLKALFKRLRRKNGVEARDDSYTITLTVGDQYGAGKDMQADITIHSYMGQILKETYKSKVKKEVQRKIDSKPFDDLQKISIENKTNSKPWYLVCVHVRHNATDTEHYADHNDWICEELHTLELKRGSGDKNQNKEHEYKYEVEISGNANQEESISAIKLKIVGQRGESESKDVPLDGNNNFEIRSTNIGSLVSVEIHQDKGRSWWWLDSLDVIDDNMKKYHFSKKITTAGSDISILPEINYTLKVATGDKTKGDISQEHVSIQLIGEKPSEKELLKLDEPLDTKAKFQKGETDQFLVKRNSTWEPKYARITVGDTIRDKDKEWFVESLTLVCAALHDSFEFEHGDWIYGDTTLARKQYEYKLTVKGYQKGRSLKWTLLLLDRNFLTVGPVPIVLEQGECQVTVKAPQVKDLKIRIAAKSDEEFHLVVNNVKCESDVTTWEFPNSGDLYKRQNKTAELSPNRISHKDIGKDTSDSGSVDSSSDDDGSSYNDYFPGYRRRGFSDEDEMSKQKKRWEEHQERQRQALVDFERGHGKYAIQHLKENAKELNLN